MAGRGGVEVGVAVGVRIVRVRQSMTGRGAHGVDDDEDGPDPSQQPEASERVEGVQQLVVAPCVGFLGVPHAILWPRLAVHEVRPVRIRSQACAATNDDLTRQLHLSMKNEHR